MSVVATSTSVAEVIEAVRSLKDELRASSAQAENDRRATDACIDALGKAGVFRLLTPARYGGISGNVRSVLEVISEVAEGDGGTAWVAMISNGGTWITGLFSEQAQDEVWGETPDVRLAVVLTPAMDVKRVEGGYQVSGRWYFGSGSLHAEWANVALAITDDNGNVVDEALALVPASDFTIDDTWYVAGMRSSGSNCIVMEDKFVPDHRIVSVPPQMGGASVTGDAPDNITHSMFMPTAALILIGAQLGLGREALRLVREKASTKAIMYTAYDPAAKSTAVQLALAEAALKIETAHLHAYAVADAIDQAAVERRVFTMEERAHARAVTGLVAEYIGDAINTLINVQGAGSFADNNPLQRIWRDSNVAARHGVVHAAVGYELYGQALAGLEPNITPMI